MPHRTTAPPPAADTGADCSDDSDGREGSAMALFPLQALFDGDMVVLLVPVDDADTMTVVAGKVAHHVVDHRVAAQDRPLRVRHDGRTLPDDATVVSAGVRPLDVVVVGYAS
ncbi:toluene-4-monooxygenase system B family protein [Streptomyces sp. NPDC055210]